MMTSITYEIDPGGDVELVLESPNKQQIVPIIKYKEDENYRVSMFDGDSDHFFENSFLVGRYAVFNIEEEDHAMEEDGQETNTANSRSDELIEVRMRVSSRHLILASLVTSDWDAAALAIVLDAIHGRYQEIPKNVSIGLMTRIATIVDYYECHECLQLISDIWISDVYEVHGVADTFCKSSLLWLYISWVFSKRNIMDPTSRMLLQETLDLSQIDLKDLPLGQILGKIDDTRQKLIGKFMTDLDDFRRKLSVENSCPLGNPDCSALMLGILIRKQHNLGLLFPSPVAPYLGLSLYHLYSRAKDFSNEKTSYHPCSCTIAWRLRAILDKLCHDMDCYILTA